MSSKSKNVLEIPQAYMRVPGICTCPTTLTHMNDSERMRVDAREERLLTVHARE